MTFRGLKSDIAALTGRNDLAGNLLSYVECINEFGKSLSLSVHIVRESHLVNGHARVLASLTGLRKLLERKGCTCIVPVPGRGPAIDLAVRLAPCTPVIWN